MRSYWFIPLMVSAIALTGCGTTGKMVQSTAADQNPANPQVKAFSAWGDVSQTEKKLKINLAGDLLFKVGHTRLSTEGLQTIDGIAAVLANHPGDLVNILEYTDNSGSSAGNLKLSQRRADAIKLELVKKGIVVDYVSAVGKGDMDPVAPNDTADNRSKNRRVELDITTN
jgi:outer membrane protein OmpA-like peptidoglycan-associated protein